MIKQTSFILFMLFIGLIAKTTVVSAFDVERVKNEIFIQLSKDLKGNPKNKPILILIGGYPGAGKTTLINALAQTYDISVISWNAIRQALLDRGLKGSPYDWEIIEAVNQHLFRVCLERKTNVIIDANAYAKNIQLFENLLEVEQCRNTYRLIKICLNPPSEILFSRISAREQKKGLHQGTEEDLLRDLNSEHKKINANDYSLMIKNDENIPFETELDIVNSLLKPYFKE